MMNVKLLNEITKDIKDNKIPKHEIFKMDCSEKDMHKSTLNLLKELELVNTISQNEYTRKSADMLCDILNDVKQKYKSENVINELEVNLDITKFIYTLKLNKSNYILGNIKRELEYVSSNNSSELNTINKIISQYDTYSLGRENETDIITIFNLLTHYRNNMYIVDLIDIAGTLTAIRNNINKENFFNHIKEEVNSIKEDSVRKVINTAIEEFLYYMNSHNM